MFTVGKKYDKYMNENDLMLKNNIQFLKNLNCG